MENIADKEVEARKSKLIDLIKNNYILIGILLFALVIRLYYFWITKDQTLWWDELSYGSLAKNLITHQWDKVALIIGETSIRPMLLPIIWSLFMRMVIPEAATKFILEIIPSFFTVLLIYFIAKRMYNRRIALISSFILAICWMDIFYTMRFMTHIPGLLFSFASIYFFFKATESEKISFKYFSLSIFLLFISILFRWNYGLVGFVYIFVLIVTQRLKFLKQKSFWLGGLVGSVPIIIFFIINLIKYNKLFPAVSSTAAQLSITIKPFAFYTINFIPHLLQLPFLIMFILGLIVVIAQLIIGIDSIHQIKKLKSHLFIFILLILNLSFLIFYIRESEDRYLFECLISIILCISIFLDLAYNFIKKYNKIFAIITLSFFLILGGYMQCLYGDAIIINKKDSYAQMKPAFLWMKDNLPKNSVVAGIGIEPYTIYYSELTPLEYMPSMNESILNKSLKVDYIVYHVFTPPPQYYIDFLKIIDSNLTIIHTVYLDLSKNPPAVVIAKYN